MTFNFSAWRFTDTARRYLPDTCVVSSLSSYDGRASTLRFATGVRPRWESRAFEPHVTLRCCWFDPPNALGPLVALGRQKVMECVDELRCESPALRMYVQLSGRSGSSGSGSSSGDNDDDRLYALPEGAIVKFASYPIAPRTVHTVMYASSSFYNVVNCSFSVLYPQVDAIENVLHCHCWPVRTGGKGGA